MKIYLASASPRRKELLEQIGVRFEILPATQEEKITSNQPSEVVQELAQQKAKEVYSRVKDQEEEVLVIGADTIVSKGSMILGKPADAAEAKEILQMLQGQSHEVYTGVAVYWKKAGKEQNIVMVKDTQVKMCPMTEAQIEAYVATKEPLDKAGSYAIQGICARYVQEIHGDYNNVVGLPVSALYQEMLKVGIDICTVS